MTPDITYTEARNAALQAAFENLERICTHVELCPHQPTICADADGVFLNVGKSFGCRGEYEAVYHGVTFTWDELVGDGLTISTMASQRYDLAKAANDAAVRDAQLRQEAERRERAELGNRKAKAAREARTAALAAAETKDPALIATLREAGVISG